MATRYWVGGTGTWDASDTTHWSATSGGAGGVSVPGSADSVFFDANSGTGTITLGYDPTIISLLMTGYAGTFDGVGSSYTITINGSGTVFNVPAGTTISGSPDITISNTAAITKTLTLGSKTYGTLTIGGGTSASNVNINGSNTFTEITSTRTVAYSLLFAISVTQTIGTWSVSGSSGKLITVGSQSSGTTTTLNITNRTSGVDYLIVRDIRTTRLAPVTFYVGDNSRLQSNVIGVAAKDPITDEYIHVLNSGTSWSTPANWNNSNNEIHLFGGGGGGSGSRYTSPDGSGGSGGGGGGYTKATNVTLNGSIAYAIGAAGTAGTAGNNGGNGGTTTFNSSAYTAGGGGGGTGTTTSSTGGTAGSGSTYNGGVGGQGSLTTTSAAAGNGGGGGGGAGGPLGNGATGGNGYAGGANALNTAGGGGGGNGGGTNGSDASMATGGTGGNNNAGTGGGTSLTGGFNGGGGGGGVNTTAQGIGGSGVDITNAGMGSGGGSGGGVVQSPPVSAAFFGAGGGGAGMNVAGAQRAGQAGGQGGIVIVYSAGSGPTSYSLNGANGSYAITGQNSTSSTGRVLSASSGSYAITGQNATLTNGTLYTLTANAGSYSITGEDADFSYNPVVLTNLETLIKLRSFTEHRRF
jgi:hypothetical protein